jgi:hypothetical protein
MSYSWPDLPTALSSLNFEKDFRAAMDTYLSNMQDMDTRISDGDYYEYVWADYTARAAQGGMVADERGIQTDTGSVYTYSGSTWVFNFSHFYPLVVSIVTFSGASDLDAVYFDGSDYVPALANDDAIKITNVGIALTDNLQVWTFGKIFIGLTKLPNGTYPVGTPVYLSKTVAGDFTTFVTDLLLGTSLGNGYLNLTPGVAGSSGGGGSTLTVAKVAHGWVEADIGTPVIKGVGAGVYTIADRDTGAAAESLWYISAILGDDEYQLSTIGLVEHTTGEWDALTGETGGLVDQTFYFLDDNGGNALSIEDAGDGQISKPMCQALSTTLAWYYPFRGVEISDAYGKNLTILWSQLDGNLQVDVQHNLNMLNPHVTCRDSDGYKHQIDNRAKDGTDRDISTFTFTGFKEADFPFSVAMNGTGAGKALNIDNLTDPEPLGVAAAGDSEDSSPRNHVHTSETMWWASLTLSASQTTNFGVNDHIEFDTIEKSGTFDLSIGAGQADGLLTLEAGKTYELLLSGSLVSFSGAGGYLDLQWYDVTGAVGLGTRCQLVALTSLSDQSEASTVRAIFTPSIQSQVELRILGVADTDSLNAAYISASITQIRDVD